MKLITVFGLVSTLMLLSVSTILVAKQNRTDDLTQEDFGCIGYNYEYNPFNFVPYSCYFSNFCDQPRKFLIVYGDYSLLKSQYETGCLSRNDQEKSTIHSKDLIIYQVSSSNC